VEHFHFEARGLRLHAVVRGEGPLTLLLHGWLDCVASFEKLAPLLPGRTVALDFRGHGDSSWLSSGGFYHFIDYIADIDAAIREFAGNDPLQIVGHSMGAATALLYCGAKPGRVSRLVMIDALPLSVQPSEVPERTAKYLDDLASIPAAPRKVPSVEEAARRLRSNNPSLPLEAALILARGNTRPSPDGSGFLWKWDPLLRGTSPLPVTDPVAREIISKVTTPLLMIRGEKGILPSEEETRARYPSLDFPIVSIPGVGHHLHLEVPEEVARLCGQSPAS
jgi:pimeloyl-ACP methyl ester carboxylesterase